MERKNIYKFRFPKKYHIMLQNPHDKLIEVILLQINKIFILDRGITISLTKNKIREDLEICTTRIITQIHDKM